MSQAPTDVEDLLVAIVLDGDRRRATASERYLDSLTIPELVLVAEAAVAGYLIGALAGRAVTSILDDGDYPHDREIREAAYLHCRLDPTRFPRLAAETATSTEFLQALPVRQQWLFNEAAAMGYVLGRRYTSCRSRDVALPCDEAIVHTVVQHCQSTSDIYPVIGEDPGDLAWKIVKNNPGRAHAPAVIDAVEKILPGRGHDAADSIIEMLDAGQLANGAAGLLVANPDEDDEDEDAAGEPA